jgi:hypothetical protein
LTDISDENSPSPPANRGEAQRTTALRLEGDDVRTIHHRASVPCLRMIFSETAAHFSGSCASISSSRQRRASIGEAQYHISRPFEGLQVWKVKAPIARTVGNYHRQGFDPPSVVEMKDET